MLCAIWHHVNRQETPSEYLRMTLFDRKFARSPFGCYCFLVLGIVLTNQTLESSSNQRETLQTLCRTKRFGDIRKVSPSEHLHRKWSLAQRLAAALDMLLHAPNLSQTQAAGRLNKLGTLLNKIQLFQLFQLYISIISIISQFVQLTDSLRRTWRCKNLASMAPAPASFSCRQKLFNLDVFIRPTHHL